MVPDQMGVGFLKKYDRLHRRSKKEDVKTTFLRVSYFIPFKRCLLLLNGSIGTCDFVNSSLLDTFSREISYLINFPFIMDAIIPIP